MHFLTRDRRRRGEICWPCFETKRSHKDARSSKNRELALPPRKGERERERKGGQEVDEEREGESEEEKEDERVRERDRERER